MRRVQKALDAAVDAVLAGLRSAEIQDRLTTLEARKADLKAALAAPAEPMPVLHPGIAEVYARKVTDLAAALTRPEECTEAAEALRALIETIRLVPENGVLSVELFGELAALLALCGSGDGKHPRGFAAGVFDCVSIKLVAGARCHLYRTNFRI